MAKLRRGRDKVKEPKQQLAAIYESLRLIQPVQVTETLFVRREPIRTRPEMLQLLTETPDNETPKEVARRLTNSMVPLKAYALVQIKADLLVPVTLVADHPANAQFMIIGCLDCGEVGETLMTTQSSVEDLKICTFCQSTNVLLASANTPVSVLERSATLDRRRAKEKKNDPTRIKRKRKVKK
jgi:hypothetical protein